MINNVENVEVVVSEEFLENIQTPSGETLRLPGLIVGKKLRIVRLDNKLCLVNDDGTPFIDYHAGMFVFPEVLTWSEIRALKSEDKWRGKLLIMLTYYDSEKGGPHRPELRLTFQGKNKVWSYGDEDCGGKARIFVNIIESITGKPLNVLPVKNPEQILYTDRSGKQWSIRKRVTPLPLRVGTTNGRSYLRSYGSNFISGHFTMPFLSAKVLDHFPRKVDPSVFSGAGLYCFVCTVAATQPRILKGLSQYSSTIREHCVLAIVDVNGSGDITEHVHSRLVSIGFSTCGKGEAIESAVEVKNPVQGTVTGRCYNNSAIAAEVLEETIMDKIKKVFTTTVDKNKEAAVAAAKLELGRIALDQAAKQIAPFLPEGFQEYANTPVGKIVLANLVSTAVAQFRPDSDKLSAVAEAMMTAAFQEQIRHFNIDAMLDDFISSIGGEEAVKKVAKKK